MRRIAILTLISVGALAAVAIPSMSQAQTTYSGTVERVWEDGFRLDTGDRTLRVDSWDVYGDNTGSNLATGDRVTITGEFAGREFDAVSISAAEQSDSGTTSAD